MRSAAIDHEVLTLEKEYWDAVKSQDVSTATRLSDDPCVVVGPQGVGTIDKKALAKMMEAPSCKVTQYRLDDRDVHVRAVADDVAVIAYKVHEDLIVDGKPTTREAYDSSVWVRRGGKWVCALHTETLAGDPYGRH
jgi:hypothetical protein